MALRIALFGQAPFGRDTLVRLLEAGHDVVGVYAPPEGARPDPLADGGRARAACACCATRASAAKGAAIPELVAEHRALRADLNVLAFVTVILPPEIVDAPRHASLCFHPSLLPRFRGGNALAWQILLGATRVGRHGVPARRRRRHRADRGAEGSRADRRPPTPRRASTSTSSTGSASTRSPRRSPRWTPGRARPAPQDEAHASHQGLVTDEVARLDFAQGRRDARPLDPRLRSAAGRLGAARGASRCACSTRGSRRATAARAPGTRARASKRSARWIAARGGRLDVGRARAATGAKRPAAELLAPGDRL